MKKAKLLFIFLIFLLHGCATPRPAALPTETPVPIEELVEEAIAATQIAGDSIQPAFPYSPAELAQLLEPGEDLEGRWVPSTVIDITRRIPGYACSSYYGSCWGDWARNIEYGAQLKLIYDDDSLGEIEFMYFEDLADVENAFQLWQSEWSEREVNVLKFTEHDPIGDQWASFGRYSEIADEDLSTEDNPVWVEHLGLEIVFSRCHGFVHLWIWFPAQTPWSSWEDLSPERIEEKDELFNLAYVYMQGVDERITPYACNP